MKLERYSSEQFAGVRNHEAQFAPGMNVVLGDNETGKSTMIAALFYALTKGSKLDGRKDKDFIADMFPSGGAETIDAKVWFSDGGKRYEIEKIWDRKGQDATTKLRDLDEDIMRGAQAERELKDLLRYGSAVYDNLIFGRQNHEEAILDWCYQFFSSKSDSDVEDVRKQIRSALSAAGGISPEKFLAKLSERMEELDGHWDWERDLPEKNRRLNNPWSKGVGTILRAWYAYQEADSELQNALNDEKEISDTAQKLDAAQKEKREVTDQQKKLLAQKNAVEGLSNLHALKAQAEKELKTAKSVQADWPRQKARVKQGKEYLALQQEAERREQKRVLTERLNMILGIEKEINALMSKLPSYPDLAADYASVCEVPHQIKLAETRLNAGGLHASIRMSGGHTARLSSADESAQEISGEADVDRNGYIRLEIPDVAEIQVAPQNMDVKALQEQIAEGKDKLSAVFRKYSVPDLAALKKLSIDYEKAVNTIEQKKADFQRELAGERLEDLHAQADAVTINPDLTISEDLAEQIRTFLSGTSSLDAAVSLAKQRVDDYTSEYISYEMLAERLEKLSEWREGYEEKISVLSAQSTISAEEFDRTLNNYRERLDSLDARIGDLQNKLGQLGEPENRGELESERDRRKDEWLNRKREYNSYRRIQTDFEALTREESDSFSGFYEKFNQYLAAIAGGTLTMKDADGLGIQSGRNSLDKKELLSAGTRKTLLLAFRLAVLSYYFPDGDGLVVLDDDLLDMDPGRRSQAAALLKDFAEQNQVIFITCDPAVADLLGGNRINFA